MGSHMKKERVLPAQVAPINSADMQPLPLPAPFLGTPGPVPRAENENSLPDYRRHQFAQGVAERLRTGAAAGEAEQPILDAIRQERLALAAALDSHDFRHAFATAYLQARASLAPNVAASLEQVHAQTDQVIAHRIADARALAALVADPAFLHEARAQAQQPSAAKGGYQLPPEKITEMIARFTASPAPYAPDAIIHIAQNMEGERVGHLALAQAFAGDGPLSDLLQQKLASHLPAADAARLSNDWLEARRNPALATAEALAEGGAVYRAVMQQLGASGHHGAAHAQPASAPAQPAAQALLPAALVQQHLMATSALTPKQAERSKSQPDKASEWAYTINHAISCGLTDVFIQPYVGKWVTDAIHHDRLPHGLHWLHAIFEKHDHDDHPHGHGACDAHHDHEKLTLRNNLGHWFGAEAISDVLAVPLTVMTQRLFPGFMRGIRTVIEPVAGGFFRSGANRDARHWAERQADPVSAQSVVNKAEELYQYEMDHLPQAVMWNAFSIPMNVAAQKIMGSNLNWGTIAVGKTFGALVSNGMLIGGRALAPNAFHHWDRWSSRTVVTPTTKIVGKLFGISSETVDKVANEHHSRQGAVAWQGRISDTSPLAVAAR